MSLSDCCLKGFTWDGKPEGRVEGNFPTASGQTYITGTSKQAAVLMIHDGFGWDFMNNRLLADHIAKEAGVTVYLPDFFNGESLPKDILADQSRWGETDVPGLVARNSKDIRQPEIFKCAEKLKAVYGKLAAIGHCYGGWAVMRLATTEHVDCIIACHPSLMTKEDIDGIAKPVQFQAPEFDSQLTPELKLHAFQKMQEKGVPFDWQHFPGVEHACLTRGNEKIPGEREAMARGKNAAVYFFKEWLKLT